MPFMSHPEHGYHQATTAEAEDMLNNGWKFDVHPLEKNPDAKKSQASIAKQDDTDILPEQTASKRPGRPPKRIFQPFSKD